MIGSDLSLKEDIRTHTEEGPRADGAEVEEAATSPGTPQPRERQEAGREGAWPWDAWILQTVGEGRSIA